MYLAMKMVKQQKTNMFDVNIENKEVGLLGALYVFKTKKAAREWFGKDVQLLEVAEFKEKGSE